MRYDKCEGFETISYFSFQIVKLPVHVLHNPHLENLLVESVNVISVGGSALLDNSIFNSSVLKKLAHCKVSIGDADQLWPTRGSFLQGTQQIKLYSSSCQSLRITYQHNGEQLPNTDYVPMMINFTYKDKAESVQSKHNLLIHILKAHPNTPPFLYSRSPRIRAEQYGVIQIRSRYIQAIDFQSKPSDIYINVRRMAGNFNYSGYFAYVEFSDTPLDGFCQQDIADGKIIYVAPVVAVKKLTVIQILIRAFDKYNLHSSLLRLTFFVRRYRNNLLSVVQNRGLYLLEGQKVSIAPSNIELACRYESCDNVEFLVWEGPRYGRLLKSGIPTNSFSQKDIIDGRLTYNHTEAEKFVDSAIITARDKHEMAFLTLPIKIEPFDNSPPFLITNKDFEVEQGKTAIITTSVLKAKDIDSDDETIIFILTKKPREGSIIRKTDNDIQEPVEEFTELELEKGNIFYSHNGLTYTKDTFRVQLSDNADQPNLSDEYAISVIVTSDLAGHSLTERNHSCLIRSSETAGMLSLNGIPSYFGSYLPPEKITFHVISRPHTADNDSLNFGDIVRIHGFDKQIGITKFTQAEVLYHKIFYDYGVTEVGRNEKILQFDYYVNDIFNNTSPRQNCTIIILPTDNKAPMFLTGERIRTFEGGGVCINTSHIQLHDIDSPTENLSISVLKQPENGYFNLSNHTIQSTEWFKYTKISNECLWYQHNGNESTADQFELSVTDGHRVINRLFSIDIFGINDQRPVFISRPVVLLTVREKSSVTLTSTHLHAADADTEDSGLYLFVIRQPVLGNLILNGSKAHWFTQQQIYNGMVSYVHNKNEIGISSVKDTFKVLVCDKFIMTNFSQTECSSSVQVSVEVLPVNSETPQLNVNSQLNVLEGEGSCLDKKHFLCSDRDTPNEKVTVKIIKPPKYGFVENIAPPPGSEQSGAGTQISTFKCSDIIKDNINYVQSVHHHIEPRNDTMVLAAYDGKFTSENVTVAINIKPKSDERPVIELPDRLKVKEGGWLKVSSESVHVLDLDLPKDNLDFMLKSFPLHGNIVYICKNSKHVWRKFPLNEAVSYDDCTFVYRHDDSESTEDYFVIAVTDETFVTKASIRIEVIPVNDNRPEILINKPTNLRVGRSRAISKSSLLSTDADFSSSSTVAYIVVKPPVYGIIQKVNILNPWVKPMNLTKNARFTQQDVNGFNIKYTNFQMPPLNGRDYFIFKVTDGKHTTGNQTFVVNVRLNCRRYAKIYSKGIMLQMKPKVIILPKNLRLVPRKRSVIISPGLIKYKIIRYPKFGILNLILKDQVKYGVHSFTQRDIDKGVLLYERIKGMKNFNDSFQFNVTNGRCWQRGLLKIKSKESVDVIDETARILKRNVALVIGDGEFATVTPLELRAFSDYPAKNVTFTVLKPPYCGSFVSNKGKHVSVFSQNDINELRVGYKVTKCKQRTDKFLIRVAATGLNQSEQVSVHELFIFKVEIHTRDEKHIRLVTNQAITSLTQVQQYGVGALIGKKYLRARSCNGSDDPNTKFIITRLPKYGYLLNTETGKKILKQFLQKDIQQKRLLYLLNEDIDSFEDSFGFDVLSSEYNCKALKNNVFSVHWSVTTVATNYSVKCFHQQSILSFCLFRKGFLKQSSAVEVHVTSKHLQEEINLPTESTVWFSPGQTFHSWTLNVTKRTGLREMLTLQLKGGFNTLTDNPTVAKVRLREIQGEYSSFQSVLPYSFLLLIDQFMCTLIKSNVLSLAIQSNRSRRGSCFAAFESLESEMCIITITNGAAWSIEF